MTKQYSVKQLRGMGLKVRVRHSRDSQTEAYGKTSISPRGGYTTVEITNTFGESSFGVAICSPMDNFSHRLGTHIALCRALKYNHQSIEAATAKIREHNLRHLALVPANMSVNEESNFAPQPTGSGEVHAI